MFGAKGIDPSSWIPTTACMAVTLSIRPCIPDRVRVSCDCGSTQNWPPGVNGSRAGFKSRCPVWVCGFDSRGGHHHSPCLIG